MPYHDFTLYIVQPYPSHLTQFANADRLFGKCIPGLFSNLKLLLKIFMPTKFCAHQVEARKIQRLILSGGEKVLEEPDWYRIMNASRHDRHHQYKYN